MKWKIKIGLLFGLLATACQEGQIASKAGLRADSNLGVPQTAATIKTESQLIGGPSAQGRIGDVLLANDRVRFVIQKPEKSAGVGSFGGTLIDADHQRGAGEAGLDQWGEMFPLINIEWTGIDKFLCTVSEKGALLAKEEYEKRLSAYKRRMDDQHKSTGIEKI